MPELMGEEHIDWNTFEVTDPEAPEYTAPGTGPDPLQDAPDDDDVDGDGVVDEPIAAEDTSPEASPSDAPPADPPVDGDPAGSGDPLVDEFLAKYGGDRDAALRGAAHQTDLIGRQGQQIGELTQQVTELIESVNRPPIPSLDTIGEIFNEDPFAAAERTYEVGLRTNDYSAHNAVMAAWKDIDPAQVGIYTQQKRIENALRDNQQRIESLPDVIAQPQRYQNALASAEARFKQEFPDLDLQALQPAMLEEAHEAHRAAGGENMYAKYMESGDPDQAYFGLRTLALAALNRSDSARRQVVTEHARAAALETQRAKAEGMLTSSTATGAEPAPPKTYDEELLDKFKSQDQERGGFNIGNY